MRNCTGEINYYEKTPVQRAETVRVKLNIMKNTRITSRRAPHKYLRSSKFRPQYIKKVLFSKGEEQYGDFALVMLAEKYMCRQR